MDPEKKNMPSIIQEIVIYDKPKVKEVLKNSNFLLEKAISKQGDITYTCTNKTSSKAAFLNDSTENSMQSEDEDLSEQESECSSVATTASSVNIVSHVINVNKDTVLDNEFPSDNEGISEGNSEYLSQEKDEELNSHISNTLKATEISTLNTSNESEELEIEISTSVESADKNFDKNQSSKDVEVIEEYDITIESIEKGLNKSTHEDKIVSFSSADNNHYQALKEMEYSEDEESEDESTETLDQLADLFEVTEPDEYLEHLIVPRVRTTPTVQKTIPEGLKNLSDLSCTSSNNNNASSTRKETESSSNIDKIIEDVVKGAGSSIVKTVEPENNSPFKKPRGRPKKAGGAVQKSKLTSFVTVKKTKGTTDTVSEGKKTSIQKEPQGSSKKADDNDEKSGSKSSKDKKVFTGKTDSNKKASKNNQEDGFPENEEHDGVKENENVTNNKTDEPKKRGRKRKADAETEKCSNSKNTKKIDDSSDQLEELLSDANTHLGNLNKVEEELQTVINKGESLKTPTKPTKTKEVAKKTSESGTKPNNDKQISKKERQQKINEVFIKKEVSDENEAEEESDRSLVIGSEHEDCDDSDGDSRKEWMPQEYAEYKQQHVMKLLKKTYPCKFCDIEFATYYGMRKHRALAHGDVGKDFKESDEGEEENGEEESQTVVHIDDSDNESRGEWMPQDYAEYKMKHKMNKEKRVQWYKCKICCAVFSSYYKLSKHKIEHEDKEEPYNCKECDASFGDFETLMAHIRVHQGKDPYQCNKCEKGFNTKEEVEEHAQIHILKKAPPQPKRFRCDICAKEFAKLCDIERHSRVHTGEKPVECNICHKRFQQSHNLSKHLLIHLQVKPFQCEICNKKFGRIDVLNRHLLTHSVEKPFKCAPCGKGFIRQTQLTNHLTKVHPELSIEQNEEDVDNADLETHDAEYQELSRVDRPLEIEEAL